MLCRFVTRDHLRKLGGQKTVGGSILQVLVGLDEMADDSGTATYTYADLNQRFGMADQQIARALNRLVEIGAIVKEHGVCERSRIRFVGSNS